MQICAPECFLDRVGKFLLVALGMMVQSDYPPKKNEKRQSQGVELDERIFFG